MELRVSAGPDRLRALREEWLELLSRSGQDEPTLAPEWVLSWWAVFGTLGSRQLYVAELRDGDQRLVGLAPLVARRRRHRGVLGLRRLELVCSGEPEQDEILSEYIGVLAERGAERGVADTLAAAVVAGRLGRADEFSIPEMNSEDPMAEALAAAFRTAGWRARLVQTSEAPYARLPKTWEAYLTSLSSRRRHTVRRSERDIELWAGSPPVVRVAQDAASLAKGRSILERLNEQRWRAEGHVGPFASSAFCRFHAVVMPALLERGALELLWLEARDEPLAVLYNLVWKGKVYFYQSGRRMDLPHSVRPGLAAHAAAIRRAIQLGRREYDFLGGAVRYKYEFSSGLRPLLTLQANRRGARSATRWLLDRASAAASALRAQYGSVKSREALGAGEPGES